MADAVLSGTLVKPKKDPDQVFDEAEQGSEQDPLAGGGGNEEEIDSARAETGTGNDNLGVKEINTARDLEKDALED
jgi:hypothetical protein